MYAPTRTIGIVYQFMCTSLPPQEAIITWLPFLSITHVFCAKRRLGHACICPKVVTGWPVVKLYPPQSLFFRGQKIADSPLKTAVSDLKCWRFLFFGKRIVTPFSTIANINRLPPESRLIRPRPMDCDPRWEKCFLVFFFRPQNTCFLVFFGQPVFFSAAGAFFSAAGALLLI